jgi:hypothetical protein
MFVVQKNEVLLETGRLSKNVALQEVVLVRKTEVLLAKRDVLLLEIIYRLEDL